MHTIRTLPPIYCAGLTGEGKQALLGWLGDFIAVLLFDKTGALVQTKEYPLGIDVRKGLGPAVEAQAKTTVRSVISELAFRKAPIQVKPFFIETWQAGLMELSDDLQDFVDNAHSVSEEDAEVYCRDLERWRAEGNCVLKWGNNYYLDRKGRPI
jgi:hypothetical protein